MNHRSIPIYAHTGPKCTEFVCFAQYGDYNQVIIELQTATPNWTFFPLLKLRAPVGADESIYDGIQRTKKAGRPRESGNSQRGGGSPLLFRPGTAQALEEVSPETPLPAANQPVGEAQAGGQT